MKKNLLMTIFGLSLAFNNFSSVLEDFSIIKDNSQHLYLNSIESVTEYQLQKGFVDKFSEENLNALWAITENLKYFDLESVDVRLLLNKGEIECSAKRPYVVLLNLIEDEFYDSCFIERLFDFFNLGDLSIKIKSVELHYDSFIQDRPGFCIHITLENDESISVFYSILNGKTLKLFMITSEYLFSEPNTIFSK